jgi:DNA-3-methyladenine glycosylase
MATGCYVPHDRGVSRSRIERAFYARDTRTVARALLGKELCLASGARGTIVETEAYHGHADRASHAHRGPTPRNAPMFGAPGHAYVYLVYGMWHCMNIVTMRAGFPAAVLVRAVAIAGAPASTGRGPGKVCQALGIDRRLSGADLCGLTIWLEDPGAAPRRGHIVRAPRVGVDYAGPCAARPWRYLWKDHPAVSRT